jgi:Tfp pilus assembly protein PilO
VNLSSSSTKTVVGVAVVVILALGMWVLLISPKRKEASELSAQVDQQKSALNEARSRVSEGLSAKKNFPQAYRQLVVLGKAVPGGDESASLLVELNRVAEKAGAEFESLALNSSGETAETETTVAPESSDVEAAPVPPTEVEAALAPLGSTVGSAGLSVMPYTLTFTGNFFQIANFIRGIDGLVRSGKTGVAVKGRLITLDSFALTPKSPSSPLLNASFSVSTFLVPPGNGETAGASPTTPLPAEDGAEPAPESTSTATASATATTTPTAR